MSNRAYYALALLLLLLASALRLWNLPTLPIGFSEAELTQIDLMRDEVQRGNIRVFYELENPNSDTVQGQEGLYHSALALASFAFGEGTFGLRILSVFAGLISIAMLYSLAVRLFGRTAGIAAAGMMSLMLWFVLLSRLVLVEAVLPLFITAVLLSLARALPVYQRNRAENTNTVDFAAMGLLLGIGLYLHPSSLFILLLAMAFIIFILWQRRPLSLRRLSYIGFAILILLIISIPYFASTLRLTDLAAGERVFGGYGTVSSAILNSTLGLFWQGDSSPMVGLTLHPLFDPVSMIFVVLGLLASLRYWREPRYALLLLATLILAPSAILSSHSPNYLAMSIILPVLLLFFGVGISLVIHQWLPIRIRWLGGLGLLALLLGNFLWTSNDFFRNWANSEEIQLAYNGDIGLIAHHLDLTADTVPTVLCYPNWDELRPTDMPLSRTELVLLHMNHDNAPLRYVDCREGFLFINAGAHQQVVIANPDLYEQIPPSVADWIGQGTALPDLPEGAVIEMHVQAELLNALGVFTTTTPASFETVENLSTGVAVAPPIRYGGNMTWLGYETDPHPIYAPSSLVPVTSYWRVEGLVPSDLVVFTHILSDPVTLVANRDTIAVNPRQLTARDVYLHIAEIRLSQTIPVRDYLVSVGLAQSTSAERLPVFDAENIVRGDRLFLYPITVQVP